MMHETFAPPTVSVRQGVLVLLLVALAFLAGQATTGPIDRDEPRYTQATKQMIETGDYVTIRFQDAPRNKKPIGIHWLQAASVALTGHDADAPLWVYRLPSLVGAIAAMLLTVWAARAFLPLPHALVVGALIGSTIILGVEARLAKTDAVLLATVVAAQGALARVWLAKQRSVAMPALFWFALALGILVKGPVPAMVAGLTIATLAVATGRDLLARLRPLIGLTIVALVCLPWFVAIYIETDGAFFANALGNDFLGKAATGQEGHGAPPLYHFALFFVVGWPLAPFALAAAAGWPRLIRPGRSVHPATQKAVLFAAAWAVPAWIVFEAIPTKLPHYTLPLLPAIALAAVAALAERPPARRLRLLAGVLVVVVPLAAVAACVVLPSMLAATVVAGDPNMPTAIGALRDVAATLGLFVSTAGGWAVLAPGAILVATVAGAAIVRGRPMLGPRVVGGVVASAVLAQVFVWGVMLPRLSPVWVSGEVVRVARTLSPDCERPRIVSVGFREPSLIFLAGTDTLLASPTAAVNAARDRCTVVAVEQNDLAEVAEAAAAATRPMTTGAVVQGFNISKGDPVRLTLFGPERP